MNLKLIKQFVKFGLVGCIATVIQYVIYLMLKSLLGINISYTIGYGVSFIFNFILSNYFTFKTKPTKEKGMKFLLAHGINYGLQILLLNVYVEFGIPDQVAPILVYLICVPVNFFLVKKALNKK
ncbi:MAG: GtrA family protein [Clostridium sp.]|uniref:GtrA family protein n=1 Tax=Clostridium sp. TaxID=1506 RepID=UPI0030290FB8